MSQNVFICHASEDKDAIARPLAVALRDLGLAVWFDEFAVTPGDSVRRKIDEGLKRARFGVVILSPVFFTKEWPQKELDALFSMEVQRRTKVLVPVWHRLTHRDVLAHSPTLADRVGLDSALGVPCLAREILQVVRTETELGTTPDERQEPRPLVWSFAVVGRSYPATPRADAPVPVPCCPNCRSFDLDVTETFPTTSGLAGPASCNSCGWGGDGLELSLDWIRST